MLTNVTTKVFEVFRLVPCTEHTYNRLARIGKIEAHSLHENVTILGVQVAHMQVNMMKEGSVPRHDFFWSLGFLRRVL